VNFNPDILEIPLRWRNQESRGGREPPLRYIALVEARKLQVHGFQIADVTGDTDVICAFRVTV